MTKQELLDKLAVLLGGRVAEEIVFGEVSTGAHDDLMKATDIAKSMVKEYGMSERLGHMTFERERRSVFLDVTPNFSSKDYSEQTAREIDNEVRRIIEDAYTRVKTVLSDKRDLLDRVAKTLLVKEVLDGDELRKLIGEHTEQNGIEKLRENTN